MRQKMNIKNDTRKNNQQNISNHRSSCRIKSSGTSINMSSIMNIFQACKTQKLRKKISKKAIKMMRQLGHTIVQPGEFAIKYAYSAPYYLFLTRIENSKETYKQDFSITFPEILDCSLGEIVNSLHLNFTVDIEWLCWQYLLAGQRTDMTILYSDRIYYQKKLINNITVVKVNIETEFSCHHTKMMILQYKDDGIRVIVSTANLRSIDWENMTQGLWISPHLPRLLESANPSDGESLTGFKKDLVRYLNKYGVNEQPVLMEWISVVQKADFSEVNVFFIASVPGIYKKNEANFWGHKKLAHVLSCHVTLPSDVFPWPIVAQSSCIGKLGSNFESWLLKDIISCMSRETINNTKGDLEFKFIYPSIQNYKQSFSYQNLSWCSPYSQEKHSKQQWLDLYLHQWKAERTERDRAMPHIKSYTRISSDLKSIPWFVLTSANLSKAAWGKIQSSGYYIGNYEAGVVFVPKFITGTTTFPIENKDSVVPVFPIPYDLPLSQYESNDGPFVVEFCNSLRWTRWMRSTEKIFVEEKCTDQMEASDEEETQESNDFSKKNKISNNLSKKTSSKRIKLENQCLEGTFQNSETYAVALKSKQNDKIEDFGNFISQKLRSYDELTQNIIKNEIVTIFLNVDRNINNVPYELVSNVDTLLEKTDI